LLLTTIDKVLRAILFTLFWININWHMIRDEEMEIPMPHSWKLISTLIETWYQPGGELILNLVLKTFLG